MRIATVSRLFGAGILAYVLAACSGSGGSNGGLTPPGVPNGASRVYVVCVTCGTSGQVLQYLTPVSNANFELALNLPPPNTGRFGVAVDPSGSRLVVGIDAGMAVYSLPLTSSTQTPLFTIPVGGAGTFVREMAFDPAGNLYVPDSNGSVYVFNAPVSNASVPAVTHTGYTAVDAVTLDAGGRIYVADAGAAKVFVYDPPFTSASSPTVTLGTANGITGAQTAKVDPFNRLAVSDITGNAIRFFNLPVTSASMPIFSVVSGIVSPECAAFDYVGNMYVTSFSAGTVSSYLAPLSGASTSSTPANTPAGSKFCDTFGP